MDKIFKRAAFTRTLFFIAADIILIILAIWLAFLLRFDGLIPSVFDSALKITLVLAIVFHIPIFYFFGLYSFSWSYVSTRELISLFFGTTFSFLFLTTAIFLSRDFASFKGFPRSTLFIGYILVILFAAGIRFSKRIYLHFLSGKNVKERQRILIIGAGDAGEQILRSIQGSLETPYLPVGFIDDNSAKKGSFIHGIKVVGGIDDIGQIVKEQQVQGMIVAFPSASDEMVKKAVAQGRKAGVENIKILPLLSEIVNDQISLADIRDFKIEDLLEREPVLYDFSSIENFLKDKVVLVTGAAGSIGSELARQIAKFQPSKLLVLDQDETGIFNIQKELSEKFSRTIPLIADIRDEEKIKKAFEEFKPQIIFHAAAYKHVPLMELEPEEAVKNNVLGTKVLVQNSLVARAEKFIFISSDKAVKPISVMGATKRIGEIICQAFNQKNSTKFISVRFGNVLGSRGSVIPVFKEQIKKGGSLKVTHEDMKRYFMIIPEAVSLVLEASEMGQGGEIFVLDMGNPIRILDLAKEIIRLSGLEPDKDIPIVFTEPRPGEKLFEEILTDEEETLTTHNKNIFISKSIPVSEQKINIIVDNLTLAAKNSCKERIKKILKEIN